MNTVARTFSSSRVLPVARTREEALVLPAPKLYMLVLVLLMMLSALSLVYVKDLNRRLFMSYQSERKNYVELQAEEGKLLLEQSLLASHIRIQEVAEQQFEMQMPVAKDVVIVQG